MSRVERAWTSFVSIKKDSENWGKKNPALMMVQLSNVVLRDHEGSFVLFF